jgi:hypothetical protein
MFKKQWETPIGARFQLSYKDSPFIETGFLLSVLRALMANQHLIVFYNAPHSKITQTSKRQTRMNQRLIFLGFL